MIPIARARLAPGMTLQLARFDEALAAGMPRRGWKVGINVPEVLAQFGLPHSAVAWIDGRRVLDSGDTLACPPGATLLVEPEIAIEIGRTVPGGASADEARACIAALRPALELVDYGQPPSGLDELVAGGILHHATVLGPTAPLAAARGLGRDWPRLRVEDREADAPRLDLVPEDPGEVAAFVARYLDAFGRSLDAGDLILAGSYVQRALVIEPGEEAVAEFGELGRVTVRVGRTAGAGA